MESDIPVVNESWFLTDNNAYLATVVTHHKVSDFNHIVSNRLGYVYSVMYFGGFVKFKAVSFCPLVQV